MGYGPVRLESEVVLVLIVATEILDGTDIVLEVKTVQQRHSNSAQSAFSAQENGRLGSHKNEKFMSNLKNIEYRFLGSGLEERVGFFGRDGVNQSRIEPSETKAKCSNLVFHNPPEGDRREVVSFSEIGDLEGHDRT